MCIHTYMCVLFKLKQPTMTNAAYENEMRRCQRN